MYVCGLLVADIFPHLSDPSVLIHFGMTVCIWHINLLVHSSVVCTLCKEHQLGQLRLKTYLTGPGLAWAKALMVRLPPSGTSYFFKGFISHTGPSETYITENLRYCSYVIYEQNMNFKQSWFCHDIFYHKKNISDVSRVQYATKRYNGNVVKFPYTW